MEDYGKTAVLEPHITKVLPEDLFNLPNPHQINILVTDTYFNEIMTQLVENLSYPYIFDDFKDHQKRREWRCQLPRKLRIYVGENSLRKNSLISIFYCIESLGELTENDIEIQQKIKSFKDYSSLIERHYDKFVSGQKYAFTKFFKSKAYNLLEKIIKEGY